MFTGKEDAFLHAHEEALADLTARVSAATAAPRIEIAQRVDTGRAADLPSVAAEAIQFVLTPYLGTRRARQVATARVS